MTELRRIALDDTHAVPAWLAWSRECFDAQLDRAFTHEVPASKKTTGRRISVTIRAFYA